MGFFGILWDSLKAPKNSLAFLEILKESLGCVCSVGWVGSNSLGFLGILRDSLGRRSVWILVRRILWDSLGFFGIHCYSLRFFKDSLRIKKKCP